MPGIMSTVDSLTGYRLPGAADRMSAQLQKDRAGARAAGVNVPEPKGASMKDLDPYVTSTAAGQLNRKTEATKAAAEGRAPVYGGSYKRGGMVKRTGLAKVHKGERVLTKSQVKRMRGKHG